MGHIAYSKVKKGHRPLKKYAREKESSLDFFGVTGEYLGYALVDYSTAIIYEPSITTKITRILQE